MTETQKPITYKDILQGTSGLTLPESAIPTSEQIASTFFGAFIPDLSGKMRIGNARVTLAQFEEVLPYFMNHVQTIVMGNIGKTDKDLAMRNICTEPKLLTLRKVLFEQAVKERIAEEK